MRKFSEINEDLFHSSVKREYTGDMRKQDNDKFSMALRELQNVDDDFIYLGGVLWSPINFGSKNIYEPGYFMDNDDLFELKEYLKEIDSKYEIPDARDWYDLLRNNFNVIRSDKYWTLYRSAFNKDFHLPQFGYISSASKDDTVSGILKSDNMVYAFQYDMGFGYEYIKKNGGLPEYTTYLFKSGEKSDKIQVRLIKRHK